MYRDIMNSSSLNRENTTIGGPRPSHLGLRRLKASTKCFVNFKYIFHVLSSLGLARLVEAASAPGLHDLYPGLAPSSLRTHH